MDIFEILMGSFIGRSLSICVCICSQITENLRSIVPTNVFEKIKNGAHKKQLNILLSWCFDDSEHSEFAPNENISMQ